MRDQDISGSAAAFDIVGEAAKALGVATPVLARAVQAGQLHPSSVQSLQTVLNAGQRAIAIPGSGDAHVQATGFEGRVMRHQIAPMPVTLVPKGKEALITLTPQRGFRVERLVLVSDAAATSKCVVNSINVGATPQFVSDGSVPLPVFAFNAIQTSMRGDTATPGITITLRIQNLDLANDETISGTFLGEAVD